MLGMLEWFPRTDLELGTLGLSFLREIYVSCLVQRFVSHVLSRCSFLFVCFFLLSWAFPSAAFCAVKRPLRMYCTASAGFGGLGKNGGYGEEVRVLLFFFFVFFFAFVFFIFLGAGLGKGARGCLVVRGHRLVAVRRTHELEAEQLWR